MTDRSRKTQPKAAEEQTDASVLRAILYLDSPTDYRECIPRGLQESELVVLDDGRGFDWRSLRDLALIALLVSMILLLALRN